MDQKLNFAFFGTPEVASKTLEILKMAGYLPALIITAPNARAGRKMLMTPPPAKVWATENNTPFIQPKKLNKEEIWDVLRTLGRSDGDGQRKFSAENFRGEQNIPNFFLVVAYGKIIPEEILNIPKFGSINIHYSLLPKYRGASPVESAILNGDTITGVTIQKMKFKMDSGPVIAQKKTEVGADETAPELRARLIKIGGDMLVKMLNTPSALRQTQGTPPHTGGSWVGVEQDESQATYCKKIKKEDGLLDLNDNPVKNYNKFRAYAHWPRIFYFKNGKRIIVTQAKLENDPLDPARGKQFVIEKILPEGKKEQDYQNSTYTLA